MTELRLGINLWSQASDWPSFLDAGRRAEALGYDHVWTWDHIYAIFGDPLQPVFEGTTALAALAQATDRVRLGLFVGANTFRNPGLAAKAITTIDHHGYMPIHWKWAIMWRTITPAPSAMLIAPPRSIMAPIATTPMPISRWIQPHAVSSKIQTRFTPCT